MPRGFRPLSFTAVSRDSFWLLGATPCRHTFCPAIVHTTDGGALFTAVPAPSAPVDLSGDTADAVGTLRFATDATGFAFDESTFRRGANASAPIWETQDDGAHWQKLPFDDVRAFATGGGSVYLLRARCTTSACTGVTLARRPLAGGDWSATSLAVGSVDQLMDLAVHGSSLWVTVSETSGPSQTLFHSADGGSSFTKSKSPCTNGLGGDLEATSSSVVWAVCPTGMLAGAARSTDGGATWHAIDVGRELANSARIAPASDGTAVVATGNQSELLRTADGGATFVRVYPSHNGFWDFLGFTDASTGTGIRSAGRSVQVVRSVDGGSTWQPLSFH